MSDGHQRQRHGVTKHLVEGLGGLVVGVAAVLLLRGWQRERRATPARAPAAGQGHTANNRMNGDEHV